MTRYDLDAIRERNPVSDVVRQRVDLRKAGREYRGACPFHAEKTPSFYVNDAKRFFHCFGCGAHGDVVGFVMRFDALTFAEACELLTERGGLADPAVLRRAQAQAARHKAETARLEAEDHLRQRLRSRKIWGETERIAGQGPALAYFARRGIDIARLPDGRLPPDIRYHPMLEYWWSGARGKPQSILTAPALVTAIRDNAGAGVGVEIKYLNFDGSKAEPVDPETGEILTQKKMRGNPWGGSIHLAPAGPVMAFGEGMETCLSVMIADPSLPVWACLSIGNMAGGSFGRGRRVATPADPVRKFRFLPSATPDPEKPAFMPPEACRRALLLEDADNADPEAAAALYSCAARRWSESGRAVARARPPAGTDFNDLLRSSSPQGDSAAPAGAQAGEAGSPARNPAQAGEAGSRTSNEREAA